MKHCVSCSKNFDSESWECPACHWRPDVRDGHEHFAPDIDGANDSYDPAWFPELAALERRNFWFIARNRLLQSLARRYLPANARYLELGCGTGFVLSMLERTFPGWSVVGTEAMPQGLPYASGRVSEKVTLQQVDAKHIPYREEFDVVGAFDVIEHIDDDATVVDQVFAALKPGGYFMLSVPQHMFLWSRYDELGGHYRRYAANEIESLLTKAGFEIMRSTSFNTLLLPLMLMSRALKRKTDAELDVMDELRISGPINAGLGFVLYVEYLLTRLGINWPVGGSRLIVARRN